MAEIAHFALETYKAEASHQDADPAHGADLDLQQVRFKENQAHPVNIAGRGSVRLLLEMARQDPDTVLTARDPVGATAALWAGLIEQKAVLVGGDSPACAQICGKHLWIGFLVGCRKVLSTGFQTSWCRSSTLQDHTKARTCSIFALCTRIRC
eukprot:SAG31_NODE_48_length_30945_cov_16.254263_22_plen_153_part_00